jgi:hypothetical protein
MVGRYRERAEAEAYQTQAAIAAGGEGAVSNAGQGAMTANQVAEKLGKGSRALNASLGAMCKDGLVLRHVDGKNITWSLAGEPK